MSERGDWTQNTGSGRFNRSSVSPSSALGEYVPPNSIEAEQSTLGAMLIERAAVDAARRIVSTADFYRDTHQVLFGIICALADQGSPVDLVSMHEELKNRAKLDWIGGMSYLTSLFETVPTAANVEYYAKIVAEKAGLRRLVSASLEIIGMARGEVEDYGETIEQVERTIMSVTSASRRQSGGLRHVKAGIAEMLAWAEDREQNRGVVSGLSTGLVDFDKITSGLQNTDLIIIAARPSMGKTSLCLSIAEHVALEEKKAVAIFSLEMSERQLDFRMACSQAMVNGFRIKMGYQTEEEWRRLYEYAGRIQEAPIWIDATPEISPVHARSELRRIQAGDLSRFRQIHTVAGSAAPAEIGLIVVDYLQLMRSHRKVDGRVQEIGEIARGLKSMAREFNCPVLALSQLSRAVEQRENKRPMLSDLRESGSIEAEADMVCFIYREAYYKQKEAYEQNPEAAEKAKAERGLTIEETEIIVGKHRNGPTGFVRVGFHPEYAKFVDLEDRRDDGPTGF